MKNNQRDIPTTEQFAAELKRLRQKKNFARAVWSTVSSLIVITAIAVIISTMLVPVLRVKGTSMTPTLRNDEILLCSRLSAPEKGDIVAFNYNNRVLLKRVIGTAGDIIDISEDGSVWRNGELLDEPYISEAALGECDIDLPYQVPENRFFVMGDHRAVSIDSRSVSVGCISEENIIGTVFAVIGPLRSFRII
jgi:signal peptidase I